MAENKTKREPIFVTFAKTVLGLSAVAGFIVVSSAALYVFTRNIGTDDILSGSPEIKGIEISSDARSILNTETKEAIFTIADANKYLKDSDYAYDPDTFQDTNAKYAGDCFLSANLSNDKDKIVFSSGCLAGDLPQPWIGVYKLGSKGPSDTFCNNSDKSGSFGLIPTSHACISQPSFYFLIGGGGRNFFWSQDDKTITYEADLGLSGMTETRIIDTATGEILEKRSTDDVSNWQTYRNEEYGFEAKLPYDMVLQKNTGEAYTSFSGELSGKTYFLQFGYIPRDVLNAMGASYCQSYPDDSRCENFSSNDLRFLIDWNIETEGAFTQSRAEILKPEGGMITISLLHSPDQDIKPFFRQILSTLKFTESKE